MQELVVQSGLKKNSPKKVLQLLKTFFSLNSCLIGPYGEMAGDSGQIGKI